METTTESRFPLMWHFLGKEIHGLGYRSVENMKERWKL